jgi:NADH:ubiquinone oxidoreductase subunit F (NADH-binding)
MTLEMETFAAAAGPAGPAGPRRVLPAAPVRGLRAHDERYGPVRFAGAELIVEVERSGLTGRGGAAFPAGRKLRAVADRAGRRGSVLVANGMESEPASVKDASLLARTPHLVLDGIALAAAAVGASAAYLCVSRPDQADALRSCLAERAARDPVAVTVTLVPDRYVASEESALTHFLNGGPAVPLFVPPRPFERGVRGRPTLVANVETLANVALIARFGAGWFRSAGLPDAPGTALVTISGAVPRPGVYEIALGTPLRDVLALAGGQPDPGHGPGHGHGHDHGHGGAGAGAVLAGGYFGAWLAARDPRSARDPRGARDVPDALDVPASAAGLRAAGASFGAGIFLVLPASGCGLAETARVLRYLAGQSAGQCGPCLHGLPAIAETMEQIAFHAATSRAQREAQRLFGLVEGRGACHLPDGVARLAASALRVFGDDVRRHQRGPCQGARGRPAFAVPAAARVSS